MGTLRKIPKLWRKQVIVQLYTDSPPSKFSIQDDDIRAILESATARRDIKISVERINKHWKIENAY